MLSLHELIGIVPTLINLFLSGFVFMLVLGWFNNKAFAPIVLILWSLFMSFIIKSFCTIVHGFIPRVIFSDSVKVFIYILIGTLLAILITLIKNAKWFNRIITCICNKNIHDDIFDAIIDYEEPCLFIVYIKGSNEVCVGGFCKREEKGLESWIVLTEYEFRKVHSKEVIYNSDWRMQGACVALNLRDIERIEVVYSENSAVWESLKPIEDIVPSNKKNHTEEKQ